MFSTLALKSLTVLNPWHQLFPLSTSTPHALLGSVQWCCPEGILSSGAHKCSSRSTVTRRSPSWQVVPAPTHSGPDMALLWTGGSRPFYKSREPLLSFVGIYAWSLRRPEPFMASCETAYIPFPSSSTGLLLVAPNWPQRPWIAEVNKMLESHLWQLPGKWDMLSAVQGRICHLEHQTLRLYVWLLNGSVCTHMA